MGNKVSSNSAAGKVLLADGTIQEFNKNSTVAELMLDHPQHLVVEFQSLIAGKRPNPLPADQKLETHKLYVMLPMRKRSSLSPEEVRTLLLRANSTVVMKSGYSGFLPLFARTWAVAGATAGDRRGGSAWPLSSKNENRLLTGGRKSNGNQESSNSSQNEEDVFGQVSGAEYLNRQVSGKRWKPSLDTIREKSIKNKVRHWLF